MKLFIALLVVLNSFSALAFTEIITQRDFKIERVQNADAYISKYKFEKGADRCELMFIANGKTTSGIIPKSTVFNGIYVEMNECYYDLLKTCKLGLSAFNDAEDLELNLTCWNRGLFSREIDLKLVNQILSEILIIQ